MLFTLKPTMKSFVSSHHPSCSVCFSLGPTDLMDPTSDLLRLQLQRPGVQLRRSTAAQWGRGTFRRSSGAAAAVPGVFRWENGSGTERIRRNLRVCHMVCTL